MATIKDVARLAGVSVSTVSKYINGGNVREENVQPICDAITRLDYRVNPFARSLKAQRNRSIGILLPDMSAPFYGSVVMALDRTLREQGYHSLISCSDRFELLFCHPVFSGLECSVNAHGDIS